MPTNPMPYADLARLSQIAVEHRDMSRDAREHWTMGHLRKAQACEEAVAEIVCLRDMVEALWIKNDSLNTLVSSYVDFAMNRLEPHHA
jgi:hypothetical protein